MSARALYALLLALLITALLGGAAANAAELADDGNAEWRLEQPSPPSPPSGVEGANAPVGLGKIGDIQFWSPNRGVLITAGNGSTVPAGVWAYDGEGWHELANVCGASDGRIAWAGPNEFWTVSDGRPGQASESRGFAPPLEDNTLCRFALKPGTGNLEVVDSYASLAFQSTSYQAMHAAGCLSASDCWFAGDSLPEPQIGSFQLHWNGRTLTAEPYLPEGHAVEDLRTFEGGLFESLRLSASDRFIKRSLEVPAMHALDGEGTTSFEPVTGLPLYGPGEFPYALDFLHLSSDADALWAAAGTVIEPPEKSAEAGVTVLRYSKVQYSKESHEYLEEGSPSWVQVLGPQSEPSGLEAFSEDQIVNAVAGEPGTHSAWLALESQEEASRGPNPLARATVAHISADGSISDRLQLPVAGEQDGPKGAAEKIVCPAVHDCWMASTRGWLFHLSTAEERAHPQRDGDPAFDGEDLITVRPADEGVPREASDAVPVDNSGLSEAAASEGPVVAQVVNPFARVAVPLLSHMHSRLIHKTELELSFQLAVTARVRLLAERKHKVVASTPTRTFAAGRRKLLLRLNAKRWPTKLDLQTHALAPLPTKSTQEANTNSVSTSLAFPNARAILQGGPLGAETRF